VLRDELEDRFGPVPEPLENLIALQQARIKFGRAGARMVSFHGEMLAATPLELSPEQAQELRDRVPAARYEPGRSQVSFRVPRDADGRFRIVVAAADALLAVQAPVAEVTAA
jgi:transcription-repair coupling factor (superfamily II helicase)